MTIYIDMDEVCVELLDEWLNYLNSYDAPHKSVKDITEWDLSKSYPTLTNEQLYSPLLDINLWERVRPVENAYKYLKQLIEDGHQVYIATASYPHSFYLKVTHCLLKHFDFLSPKDIICINNKSLLRGDILFDDYPENLRNFTGIKVLKNKPYNTNCDDSCADFRVDKWEEFYSIVKQLMNIKEKYNCE